MVTLPFSSIRIFAQDTRFLSFGIFLKSKHVEIFSKQFDYIFTLVCSEKICKRGKLLACWRVVY